MFEPNGVSRPKATHWLAPVRAALADAEDTRGLIVRFPSYRPDLVETMARSLDLVFVDFRKTCMAPLGFAAAKIPLGELSRVAIDAMERGSGVVLHNCEALLGLHAEERRAEWFARLVSPGWEKPFVAPVTLFADDLPAKSPRVVELDPDRLPAANLLSRLAGLR